LKKKALSAKKYFEQRRASFLSDFLKQFLAKCDPIIAGVIIISNSRDLSKPMAKVKLLSLLILRDRRSIDENHSSLSLSYDPFQKMEKFGTDALSLGPGVDHNPVKVKGPLGHGDRAVTDITDGLIFIVCHTINPIIFLVRLF